MEGLELVRAGAGSGKTTDLCRVVAEAVAAGLDPARILATTFTKKAAAELKGRVQAELLGSASGKPVDHRNADRLELAAIGTVHSVAHQLLSRYALDLGLSPRLDVLSEAAAERALNAVLGEAQLTGWGSLLECAGRLGVTDLPSLLLRLLAAKRGNLIGDGDFRNQMADSANGVCGLLAPDGFAGADPPVDRLFELAAQALSEIDALPDTQKNTEDARRKLRQLGSKQMPIWGSHVFAAQLKAGKRSGADGRLDPLRNHAAGVRRLPGLKTDLVSFSERLADATIQLETGYAAYKTERGLVDFTDLETLLLRLLRNETLTDRLSEDFELVLVDEFQDTNPLQLAIFERLRRISPRNRWVGDPKQAIYGFRGADPALVDRLWEGETAAVRSELLTNYRSQGGLVELVGELFRPVFNDDAVQETHHQAAARGVERWTLDSNNQTGDAMAIACGVAKLRGEGVRFREMVVLERTNQALDALAAACDELGVPYLRESPGLLATREGRILLAGLRLVADRGDSLAAATILHLIGDPEEETPTWVAERLREVQLADGRASDEPRAAAWEGDDRFARTERIDRSRSAPTVVVQQVIESLGLPTLVPRWGDPARRNANLDSMLRHARQYEDDAINRGQAATLAGFIVHLERLGAERHDVRFPPLGHDAVTLTTYHSAKGLEWPVVILCGLNSDRTADMWTPAVTGGGQLDGSPLSGRSLRCWTWPFGRTDGPFGGLRKGSGLEGDALSSPEGREQSARDAEESLRLLYVGCTRAKEKLVFAHREGKYAWLEKLAAVDALLDPTLDEGEHELEGVGTSLVVRRLSQDMANDCRIPPAGSTRWFAPAAVPDPAPPTERFHSPSAAAAATPRETFEAENLPGECYYPSGAKEEHHAAIGDAVHSYLAALPSLTSLSDGAKERIAERCLAAFSVSGLLAPAALVAAGERFREWVDCTYPGSTWHTEVAACGPRAGGGAWNGAIDLVIALPTGGVVVVDHKSAPIPRERCAEKAGQYAGQLDAYQELLTSAGETVEAVWIHFPLAGVVARRLGN